MDDKKHVAGPAALKTEK